MSDDQVSKVVKSNSIVDLVTSFTPHLVRGLTPELVTQPETALSMVFASFASEKIEKIINEFKQRKENGKIGDIEDNPKIKDSFYDLLKFIQNNPEEERVEAIKKLFFISIEPETPESEQQLIFEFMQICKKLSTNEIVILKANFELALNQSNDMHDRNREMWARLVAHKIGHKLTALVQSSENHLEEIKLICSTEPGSTNQYFPPGKKRLTDLGYSLCEYLYEK